MTVMQRARPRHALANDSAISAAAVDMIAERGWDATTLAGVTTAASLTYGAGYSRYADRVDLALHLWSHTLEGELSSAFAAADEAIGASPTDVAAALTAFFRPSASLLAAVDLLQAAAFDDRLQDAIWSAARTQPRLTPLTHPGMAVTAMPAEGTPSVVRATTRVLALGLLLIARRPWVAEIDPAPEFARYAHALRNPVTAMSLPEVPAEHLRDEPFQSDDERVDAVLNATAHEVGSRGYRGATLNRIIRASSCSPAYIYQRWPAKRDLVAAAGEALLERGIAANAQFLEDLSVTYGRGIAEAVAWRSVTAADLGPQRRVLLEINRAATFDEQMAALVNRPETALMQAQTTPDARAYAHTEIALGLGLALAANLWPQIEHLPFDTITVPLTEGTPILSPIT